MSIRWRQADLAGFFGASSEPCEVPGTWSITYRGVRLWYQVFVLETEARVAVIGTGLGDREEAGAHAPVETYVPCTDIVRGPDPYDASKMGLYFYYGDPAAPESLVLTILKRPDGDLKIWTTVSAHMLAPPKGR